MTGQIDKDLLDINAYPEPTKKVELVQTHISFVFLTDNFVYKVKKPVNFGFLDFTTLEKRLHYCNCEVKLNRRLSPETCLGVFPVTDEGGKLRLSGDGDVVDYAVKMKRIPMDKLMIKLLRDGKITKEMIEKVSEKIAKFHANSDTSDEIDKFGEITSIKINTDENFDGTDKYIDVTITKEEFESIRDYTNNFYRDNEDLFIQRIKEKRIRDCHGDLHMEHICFSDPITVFDCIEFNDRFRYCDTASDIAFLAMDLDFHGAADFSNILIDSYVRHSEDRGVYDMLNFYKVYRAYVRGKVISFRLDDEHISKEDKDAAIKAAKKYFELAESYTRLDKTG